MELQICYMTLQESKDILKKDGYLVEATSNFSQLLKEVGTKSFHEKNPHFARYDTVFELLHRLRQNKKWNDPPFMKEDDDQMSKSSNSNKNYGSKQSSPIKIVPPPMRHDSLESHERNSESASSHD